jgi:UDP-glucose 4-epimerase
MQARRINPVPRRVADIEKARRLLEFESRISLAEGLATFVDWWMEERAGVAA